MTHVHFIRHAESDRSVRDGRIRPLTPKGLADRHLATAYLRDKSIDVVLSSPFRRAVDTIASFAEEAGLSIELIEDFREQNSGDGTPRNNGIPGEERDAHFVFLKRQWEDPSYKIGGGESLAEVQRRNIAALRDVLTKYPNQNIAIGTHGMALSTIINYYDPAYGFAAMRQMVDLLPWAVTMTFDGDHCVTIEKVDLF